MPSTPLSVALGLTLLLPTWALAQPASVTLEDIPQRLTLPLERGHNHVITARIEGAAPQAVWLATTAAGAPLSLTPVRGGWAINLGDPRLAPLVVGHQTFQIFARLGEGRVISSVPVSYLARRHPRAEVWARTRGEHPDTVRVDHEQPAPLAPSAIARLKVKRGIDPGPSGPPVRALSGAVIREFTRQPDGEYVLDVDAPLATAWRATRALTVVDEGSPWPPLTVPAIPDHIDPKALPAKLTVYQRRSAEIPGTHGWLTIHLGDISGARVEASLYDAHHSRVGNSVVLTRGDEMPFSMGAGRYVIRVDKLVNVLGSKDYVELIVEPAPPIKE